MDVLYIYRNPGLGISIGKNQMEIQERVANYCEVDSITLPMRRYRVTDLIGNILYVRNYMKKHHFDVVYITGTENYLLPFIHGTKKAVTVHDLGFYINSRKSARLWLKKKLFIDTLQKADCVICISEQTREEVKRLSGVEDGRIRVIGNPVSPLHHYVRKKPNLTKPRILQIGTKANKNLENTIVALENFTCHLRIIGRLTEEQVRMLEKYKMEYSNDFDISDEKLVKEYEECDILNFPSLYEGFGVPPLEAQATGRLVITSDRPPMRDIMEGTAVLVDPESPQSILEGYRRGISGYEHYVRLGLEHAKKFSIDGAARQYYEAFRSVLDR